MTGGWGYRTVALAFCGFAGRARWAPLVGTYDSSYAYPAPMCLEVNGTARARVDRGYGGSAHPRSSGRATRRGTGLAGPVTSTTAGALFRETHWTPMWTLCWLLFVAGRAAAGPCHGGPAGARCSSPSRRCGRFKRASASRPDVRRHRPAAAPPGQHPRRGPARRRLAGDRLQGSQPPRNAPPRDGRAGARRVSAARLSPQRAGARHLRPSELHGGPHHLRQLRAVQRSRDGRRGGRAGLRRALGDHVRQPRRRRSGAAPPGDRSSGAASTA